VPLVLRDAETPRVAIRHSFYEKQIGGTLEERWRLELFDIQRKIPRRAGKNPLDSFF
jgi:hypothetical protein